jgi:hypothetical protein
MGTSTEYLFIAEGLHANATAHCPLLTSCSPMREFGSLSWKFDNDTDKLVWQLQS